MAHFQKALAVDSRDADIHRDLGGCYLSMREYESAEQSYEKAVELAPESGWYRWLYACVLSVMEKREAERDQYDAMLELGPQYQVSFALYHLYYRNFREALTWVEKGEKTNPGDPWSMWYSFICHFLQHNYREAEAAFSQFLERQKFEAPRELRRQAFPDDRVDRDSLVTYLRLLLQWVEN